MKILVTAGPTVEPIDPVRFLTNRSSGRMGYAVAQEALAQNHEVTLISGPTKLAWPEKAQGQTVQTAQEMFEAVCQVQSEQDLFILCAAVSDYTPAHPYDSKFHKKNENWELTLKPTPDILAYLGKTRSPKQVIAGFCLDTQDHVHWAQKKVEEKKADFILANDIAVIDSEHFQGWLIDSQSQVESWDQMTKPEAARRYLKRIFETYQTSHATC